MSLTNYELGLMSGVLAALHLAGRVSPAGRGGSVRGMTEH